MKKNLLTKLVPVYQAAYDSLRAIGITPTMAELAILTQYELANTQKGYLDNYVRNKLLDLLAPYQINGVVMTREFFRNNIQMPDTSAVAIALRGMRNVVDSRIGGVRKNLLVLANNVISKVADSDAQITAAYSFYTKTDASAQLATDLQVVCNALNTFEGVHNDLLKLGSVGKNYNQNAYANGKTQLPGIDVRNQIFVVSLEFIRDRERNQHN